MTAEEFITAVSAGGTIDVDSDIDFNEYYFSAGVAIPDATIINGNGYTLTNIQQGAMPYIFVLRSIEINRLNCRNVNIPNGSLFYSLSTDQNKYANECQISGYIYRLHYGSGSSQYNAMTFKRCSLTLDRFYELNATLKECYVVLKNNLIKGSTSSFYYFGRNAESCYFKGEISNENGSIRADTNFNNCCFNVEIRGNSSNNTSLRGSNLITVANADKIDGPLSTDPYIIPVTDTQMHDAKSLFDVGFNIYVPGD